MVKLKNLSFYSRYKITIMLFNVNIFLYTKNVTITTSTAVIQIRDNFKYS